MKTFFTGVFGFLLGAGMSYIILHDPNTTSPSLNKKLAELSLTDTISQTKTICKSCGGFTVTKTKSHE